MDTPRRFRRKVCKWRKRGRVSIEVALRWRSDDFRGGSTKSSDPTICQFVIGENIAIVIYAMEVALGKWNKMRPCAMLLLAGGAPALSAAPVLEEVLVTAQKRSESVNDVPITITALAGEKFAELGLTDTRDLGKVTPGFTFSKSGVGTPVYTLRGVGFNDQSFFASPTVSVYVDEAPLPFSFMSKGPNLDVERVEVLKGPQGTLFGRNTTGGAINYISNKPGDEFSARLHADYSRYQRVDVEGMVTGPITEELNGRLAVRAIHAAEGWQQSVSRPRDRLGQVNKLALRGIADWQASEQWQFRVTASGWIDKSDPQSPQAIAIIPQNPFTGGAVMSPRVENAQLIDQDTDDNSEADWTTELALKLNDSFFNLVLHANWYVSEDAELVAITSLAQAESDQSVIPAGLDALVSDYEIDANLRTVSQELRFAVADGQGVDWMVGGNISFDEGDQHNHAYDRDVSSAFPVGGQVAAFTDVGVAGESEARQMSLFSNIDWFISQSFKLTVGARYNDEVTEFQGCSFDEPESEGSGLGPLFSVVALSRGNVVAIEKGECFTLDESGSTDIYQGKLEESNLSGRVTLNWTPTDDLLAYVSFARGTKSGGFPVLPASDQSQYEPVTQEILVAWELGIKATLFGGSTQLNGAAFDYDYKDKQLLTRVDDPFFGPLPILRNAPASFVRGAELSLSTTPLEGLLFSLAASWIKTEIEEFESLDINGEPRDFSGRPFNYSPKLQYNLGVDYETRLNDSLYIGAAANYSYRDDSNATLEGNPLYAMDAYGLLDMRLKLGSNDGVWKAALWGRNITNEFQAINVYQIADIVGRYTGMPVTYGLSATYQW